MTSEEIVTAILSILDSSLEPRLKCDTIVPDWETGRRIDALFPKTVYGEVNS